MCNYAFTCLICSSVYRTHFLYIDYFAGSDFDMNGADDSGDDEDDDTDVDFDDDDYDSDFDSKAKKNSKGKGKDKAVKDKVTKPKPATKVTAKAQPKAASKGMKLGIYYIILCLGVTK